MAYKVVCIREFVGLRSNGTINMNIQLPVLNAVYTCIDENFDDLGLHSLILAELSHKAGYNSEYFAPVDDAGIKSNATEIPAETTF
jgi:hypothetical protein